MVSPSWSTMGSPALVIILRKGRGIDATHGAKCQDEEGRLHFCFHSFVSFNVASRYCGGEIFWCHCQEIELISDVTLCFNRKIRTLLCCIRTIMALWRTRALPPEQKEQIVEEQLEKDEKLALSEDAASYLVVEDVKMSKVYSAELPVNVSFSMLHCVVLF